MEKYHLGNNILEVHSVLRLGRPGSIPQLIQFVLVVW